MEKSLSNCPYELSLEQLMQTSVGAKIQQAIEIIHNIQNHYFAIIEKQDELDVLGIRTATVMVFAVLRKIAEGKRPCSFDSDDWKDITVSISKNAILPDDGQYAVYIFDLYERYIRFSANTIKVVVSPKVVDSVNALADELHCKAEERVTCEKAHGTLDLKGALAHSCNCAFAQISELVGKKNMTAYVKKFGLTQSVHFDGITTAKGNYDVSNTAQVSFAWSCIGQYTDLINPCRFMTFMGSIAGGGVGAEPYIVSRVSSGGKQVYAAETKKTDRIVSAQVAKTLTQYLENNVKSIYGAGNFPGLTVCAKSGTSQLGGGKTSNAMFAGFVADEAYPLAFIVVVENGGYGANTCVPVISRVLAECKQVLDGE